MIGRSEQPVSIPYAKIVKTTKVQKLHIEGH